MMRKIAGRPAVITGAASGIGRSLAQRLSRLGSPVVIADVDAVGLGETAASLRGPVLSRVLDVRDAEDVGRFAAEVRAWLDLPLAAVFNNAGVATSTTVLNSVPEDDSWLFDINYWGVVNGTRAFLPQLVEQNYGVVVNTSSVYGLLGIPKNSAYCAAKFAVRGFTDSLRQELRGTGVSAVTVHPGGIKTNIVRARSCAARASPPSPCTPAASRPTSSATPASTPIPTGRAARWSSSPRTSTRSRSPPRTGRPRSSTAASSGARRGSWSDRTPTCSTRSRASPRRTTSA
ncbi:NADP-dependent 3-hydroxy acid dehydrogenase YdfG [Lentzea xinjiangensis]|uniref:NADP-dependent 3-hydroxy acid dehydrogenase YdfG n=1 Tax=Lentzea xinjiangensis TaxID=402600 RepID=A0A1H9QK35_9PSEU|nr:SDR family oxidoreductase [Lentzea xinjiangensis]SER60822.1 NADP-dependent 3-hydroxy acid dehydrogenase YdfG [Lentzea xinjiangensis]